MRKLVSSFLIASCAASVWATPTQVKLDSINASVDTLASNMESTLLGKDDLPMAVSGFMAFRVKNFHYSNTAPAFASDEARTAVDAVFKANLVV